MVAARPSVMLFDLVTVMRDVIAIHVPEQAAGDAAVALA
jgi:hypothetical protein